MLLWARTRRASATDSQTKASATATNTTAHPHSPPKTKAESPLECKETAGREGEEAIGAQAAARRGRGEAQGWRVAVPLVRRERGAGGWREGGEAVVGAVCGFWSRYGLAESSRVEVVVVCAPNEDRHANSAHRKATVLFDFV